MAPMLKPWFANGSISAALVFMAGLPALIFHLGDPLALSLQHAVRARPASRDHSILSASTGSSRAARWAG
jgi:hypothetical protein